MAVSLPIPDEAPVTIITFPFKDFLFLAWGPLRYLLSKNNKGIIIKTNKQKEITDISFNIKNDYF